MSLEVISSNFLNPPILCFFLGVFACLLKSDLDIPHPLPKLFSIYLLFSLGFKGGLGLAQSGFDYEAIVTIALCVIMSFAMPFYVFQLLKRKTGVADAAAIAATYGSVSAVTFITATAYLEKSGIAFGSHMIAAMALMESPAIIAAVLLARKYSQSESETPWSEIIRDAFLNGSVVLLVGGMLIGMVTGERGLQQMHPFTHDLFYGMLSLFLLDMGIVSARRFEVLRKIGSYLFIIALAVPLLNASIALSCVWLLGLGRGDSLLVVILAASASYIAVPAAMRIAIPEAKASLFLPMSLAITFPFNIIVGIPLYDFLIRSIGIQ